jgi:N-carbamoyl-L-amino-acid hydrolase
MLEIDVRRLWERHEAMARFGATPRGGVNRQALSHEDFSARRQLIAWGESYGLRAAGDAAGNLFFRLTGRDDDAPPVLTGSHLDSQPTGGKYDGTFGVLAGLEALGAIRAANIVPRHPIELVAWMNEEGSRFAPGMMGSEAFAGIRSLEDIRARTDCDGISVGAALDELAAIFPDLAQRPLGFPVKAFIEAHIEQGPELEACAKQIGVVSGIQGKKTYRVTLHGTDAHAGTTRRAERRDALRTAVTMIEHLYANVDDDADVVRFTVGRLVVEPNAPSVVPGRAEFSIDLRHPDAATLHVFGKRVVEICRAHAAPCTINVEQLVDAEPLVFPDGIRAVVRAAAERRRLSWMALPSAAGHDARNLHYVCPAGMIFIPCARGVSHNEAESVTADDMAAGTGLLAETLVALAG